MIDSQYKIKNNLKILRLFFYILVKLFFCVIALIKIFPKKLDSKPDIREILPYFGGNYEVVKNKGKGKKVEDKKIENEDFVFDFLCGNNKNSNLKNEPGLEDGSRDSMRSVQFGSNANNKENGGVNNISKVNDQQKR